jgi:hypothetical protein
MHSYPIAVTVHGGDVLAAVAWKLFPEDAVWATLSTSETMMGRDQVRERLVSSLG